MDPALIKGFADYGFSGLLVAVIVLLYWHQVKVQTPAIIDKFDRMLDRSWKDFLSLLEAERKDCRDDRAKDWDGHQRNFDALRERLERIESISRNKP